MKIKTMKIKNQNQTLQAKKKVKREEKKRDKKEAKKLTGKSELRLLKNEAFTHYYESQLPFLREGEWAEVEQCLRSRCKVREVRSLIMCLVALRGHPASTW